jgi:hypothetical protein
MDVDTVEVAAAPAPAPAAAPAPSPTPAEAPVLKYKSFKKKYRKMRLTFEEKMNSSNILYKNEQQAAETARRLALENECVGLLPSKVHI